MKKILCFSIITTLIIFTLAYAGVFHEYIGKCDNVNVKKLIENGIDINSLEDGNPPLWYALSNDGVCGKGIQNDKKRYELVKLLIDNGGDANLGEYAPTYFYAYNCNTYAIKCYDLFIGKGADLLIKKEYFGPEKKIYYMTPLSIIFQDIYRYRFNKNNNLKSKLPSIKYLLGKGLDANIVTLYGGKKSLLDIAYDIGDFELINLLKKYNAKKRIDLEIDNMKKE